MEMVSAIINRTTRFFDNTNEPIPRNRNEYYRRHLGLRPILTTEPLPDTNGLRLGSTSALTEVDLLITDIDLNIYRNSRKHYCDRYDITTSRDPEKVRQVAKLVIRRGFSFEVTLRLNRPYKKETDEVFIEFAFGDRPKIPKKTLVRIPIKTGRGIAKEWSTILRTVNANELTVEVNSPSNCFVGIWRMYGYVTDGQDSAQITSPKELFMLFNPFNREDEVFMHIHDERTEYVMNENGLLVIGTPGRLVYRPWAFSQFYGHVLEYTMDILETTDIPYTDRGRPVMVCRRLAAMINNADVGGVLFGKWDGEYSDGTPPTDWIGSVAILEQYSRTKRTVKYGQCWVFSAVLTTVCRALGIPCRSVTNFSAAHDTDSSVTIDNFFNEKYQPEEFMNDDSIWNFHMWNDVYMQRPDLANENYGGWQALDSTPQETSDGFYSCGPCPLIAIKEGDINTKYDAPFIIAEVDADLILWVKSEQGNYEMSAALPDRVGKAVYTKMVNEMRAINITDQYKYPEGSRAGRRAINRAIGSGSRGFDIAGLGPEDVKLELVVDNDTPFGADFTTKLIISNIATENRTLNGNYSVMTVSYTGTLSAMLHDQGFNFSLQPLATHAHTSLSRYETYAGKVVDHENIRVRAIFDVGETKRKVFLDKIFRLKKPELIINAPAKAKVSVRTTVEVSFKNPLPKRLTRCTFSIGGSGLTKFMTKHERNIKVGEMFSTRFEIRPWKRGKGTLVITFSSNELNGLAAHHEMEIVNM